MDWGAVAQFFTAGFDCSMRDRSLCAGSRKEALRPIATVVGPSAAAHIERRPVSESKFSEILTHSARFSEPAPELTALHPGIRPCSQHFAPECRTMPDVHGAEPSPCDRTSYDPFDNYNRQSTMSTDSLPPCQYPTVPRTRSPSPEPVPNSRHGSEAPLATAGAGMVQICRDSWGGSATHEVSSLDGELPPDFFKTLGTFVSRDRAVQMRILCGEAHWCVSSLSSLFLQACMMERWKDASQVWTALHVRDQEDLLSAYSCGPPTDDFFVNIMMM